VLVAYTTQGINNNQHVVLFLHASEFMVTWGPKLIPDPSMYMIQMSRRQHIRIHNEMDEMSQENILIGAHGVVNKDIVEGLALLTRIMKVIL
jgi:hypothetical protein